MREQGNSQWDAAFNTRAGFDAAAWVASRTDLEDWRELPAESITVTREMSGDLPESATLVGGGVSVRARIVADAGSPTTPTPLNPDDRRAFIGAHATVDAGYSGLSLPMVTGVVRELSADVDARTVTLDVADRSASMTAPVTVTTFGSVVGSVGRVVDGRYPTNLSAVIVAALHASGRRMTPAPRVNCVLSIPLLYGALPEVGWVNNAGAGVPEGAAWLVPGKFGPMPSSSSWTVKGFPSRHVDWGLLNVDSTVQVEAWVNTAGAAVDELWHLLIEDGNHVSERTQLRVNITNARVSVELWQANGTTYVAGPTLTATAGWHHVSVRLHSSGQVTLWVDGRSALVELGSTRPSGMLVLTAKLGRVQALEMYVGNQNMPAPSVPAFAADADVEQAILEVDYLPAIDQRIAWELCRDVAAAEFGMVGFTEAGRFYFRNRTTMNANTAAVATWSTDLLANIEASAALDSVRSRVVALVERSGLRGGTTFGWVEPMTDAERIVTPDGVLTVPSGVSTHLIAASEPWVPDPYWSARVPVATLAPLAGEDAGMTLCGTPEGGQVYTQNQVRASISMLSPSSGVLTIDNRAGRTLYAVYPQGWQEAKGTLRPGGPGVWIPAMRMNAPRPVHRIDVQNATTAAAYGDRAFELEASPWRQSPSAVDVLARSLLADMREPRLEVKQLTVPADLRYELGDVVNITDWQGRIPSIRARITRAEVVLSESAENGMQGTYEVRTLPT